MHDKDIIELLEHNTKKVAELKTQSENGKVDKVILKNVMENFRSILDYTAQDISNKVENTQVSSSPARRIYFPYGQRENHFKRAIKKNLPELETACPIIYDLVESIQPFRCHDNWLVDLCKLANEAKHNGLSKTEDQKTRVIEQPGFAKISGSANVVMRGNMLNGVPLDDVYSSQDEVHIVKHSGTTVIYIDSKINFQGRDIEIVPFMEKCTENTKAYVKKLYGVL